jgi:3D (Asp-Asp-Asp) domain-containing protein
MNATRRIIIRGFIPLILASITITDVDRPVKNHDARTSLYTSILAQIENCTYDSTEAFSEIGGIHTTVAPSLGTADGSRHQYSTSSRGITAEPASRHKPMNVHPVRSSRQVSLHHHLTPQHHAHVHVHAQSGGITPKHPLRTRQLKPMDVALIRFDSVRKYSASTVGTPIGEFTLTAYSLSRVSTGKVPGMPGYGITYSGTKATVMRTVAVDPRVIPIGTPIFIEGIGWRLAEDTGGAVKGRHIDVLLRSHEEAIQFGVRRHIRVYLERSNAESAMSRLSKE